MQPTPQPKAELADTDVRPGTLTATINPSIVLMDSATSLKILLSRNTLVEPRATKLLNVRLIEIPLGWRLSVIRLLSRFFKVRLADEWDYSEVRVQAAKTPSPAWVGDEKIGQITDAAMRIPLTGSQYFSLLTMNGRTLHEWVTSRFKLDIRGVNRQVTDGRRAA